MSLNWVMLPDATNTSPTNSDFIPLPNERTIFKSSHRTSLSLSTPKSTYPAHSANLSINSSDGTLHLTNQRIIYLPRSNSTISSNVPSFKSFSCPLLNLHDTHLVMPWFGPNSWTALVQPVAGGGLHAPNIGIAGLELRLTFKEGGAAEFQGRFEAIKERLQQVVDVARESNASQLHRGSNLNLANVHLEQLPSYQDSGHDRVAQEEVSAVQEGYLQQQQQRVPTNATAEQVRAMAAAAATQRQEEQQRRQSGELEVEAYRSSETLPDAPPGYEEIQQQSVRNVMETRLPDRTG